MRNLFGNPDSSRRAFLIAGFLGAAAFLVYLPALNGTFIWDDDSYLVNNPAIRSWLGLIDIWLRPGAVEQYYPLVFTSFLLEYKLWGLNPFGYHAINVALHTLNALLVWRLLKRLEVPGSWLAALIFAVHPVHVESVAWISERKNTLSGFFYLSSLLAYARFSSNFNSVNRPLQEFNRRDYWLSFFLFLFALLSKTVTCSLPVVMLMLVWWKQSKVRPVDAVLTLPFFLIALTVAPFTLMMEKHIVGTEWITWDLSFIDRCLIAGRALWFYFLKLLWPHPLIFNYPRWTIDASAVWPYLFPFGFLAAAGLLWKMSGRWGRGPLIAVLFFAVTLFPALGFFNVYPMRFSFVADHFQYLASIGLIALLTASGALLARKLESKGRSLAGIAAGLVAILFSLLSWKQAHAYKSAEALWRATAQANPKSFLAHNNLAVILLTRGDYKEAQYHFERVLDIDPEYPSALVGLGTALHRIGRSDEALSYLKKAVEVNPNFPEAHTFLAEALYAQGQRDQALAHLERSLQLNPFFPYARILMEKVKNNQPAR